MCLELKTKSHSDGFCDLFITIPEKKRYDKICMTFKKVLSIMEDFAVMTIPPEQRKTDLKPLDESEELSE